MICANVCLKLVQWFWRRFLIFNIILLFCYYLPFDPLFEQTWIPITQGCFVASLVLEKKTKMWNFTDRRTDGRTDDGQQAISKARAFSSCELKGCLSQNMSSVSRTNTEDLWHGGFHDQEPSLLKGHMLFIGYSDVSIWKK